MSFIYKDNEQLVNELKKVMIASQKDWWKSRLKI